MLQIGKRSTRSITMSSREPQRIWALDGAIPPALRGGGDTPPGRLYPGQGEQKGRGVKAPWEEETANTTSVEKTPTLARCAVAMLDVRRLALPPPHSDEHPQKAEAHEQKRSCRSWFGYLSKAHVGGVVYVS